jgi:hypothetical protein
VGDFDSEVGKIGDVGLGPVRKAKYIILDPQTKEVEREWGFEILRDEVGDIWGVDKPYVNIYRRNFKCYVTADKGQVQVETAVGRTTPKDATFTDNVVVHILPEGPSTVQESFVYLDDITFLSERSQLSTAGPVRFVSQDVQMSGTGLELIYDDQKERLDFFRIVDLESLRIKGSQAALFSTGETEADGAPDTGKPAEAGEPAEAESQAETRQPDETAVAGSPEKTEELSPDTQPQAEQKQGAYYKCIFSKNVLIDTPDELVFADERVCVNDIFWSKTSSEQSDEVGAGGADDAEPVAVTAEEEQEDKAMEVSADNASRQNVTASKPVEPNKSSEERAEIVVTSENGLVLVPMDSTRSLDDYTQPRIEEGVSDSERPEALDDETGRTRFLTPRIDYNATTGDVIADGLSQLTYYTSDAKTADANEAPVPVKITAREAVKYFKAANKAIFQGDCLCTMPQAGLTEQKDVTFWSPEITVNLPEDRSKRPDIFAAGPTELVFYAEDANSTDLKKEPIPVTVNAQKQTRFLAESNQIIFDGDCRCTSQREDPNVLTTYMLLSQQITVDLPEDTNDRPTEPAAGIKHLTASGGVVTLATTKTAKADTDLARQPQDADSKKSLGGVELKCSQVDYDPVLGLFVAAGPPAIIKMDNSKISAAEQKPGRVSLRKPCYAFLQEFDTLTYFIQENRIVADAGAQRLLIDYFSVVEGKYAEHVEAEAARAEAFLYETPEGQTELSTLRATGGIDYEDKDNHFIGSELFYDHKKSMLKVKGDESQPCYYNGALVDEIEYDLETGRAEFEVVGPGALQMNR